MKKTSRKRGASTRFAGRTGSAPSPLVVKAWAIVNKETGRLMLREVQTFPGQRTEMPCIWMKRSEADYYKSGGERIVRVAITETTKMTIDQASLREKIERMDDVKTLLRLEPHGDRFRYQIETPFRTWPAFVIGTTDAEGSDVRIEHRCGLRESSDEAWASGQNAELTREASEAQGAKRPKS